VQVWQPTTDEVDQDAGRETLAEQVALEVLACPQGSAAKPYVAALCKVRTRCCGFTLVDEAWYDQSA